MNLSEFGRRVAHLRKLKGWTQYDLARAMDMSVSQIRNWEGGRKGIRPKRLLRLYEVLGVTPAQFWDMNLSQKELPLNKSPVESVPEVNERQRAVRCPRCKSIGNNAPDEGLLYCYHCGYPMYNICTGEEKHVNSPIARYCERCAARTVWSMTEDELAEIGIPAYEQDGRSTDSNE